MCEHQEHTNENSWWEYDARGIPLCRVCEECVEEKLSRYRQDVLTDSSYWADEEIEDD
jgi:hypothetical protein